MKPLKKSPIQKIIFSSIILIVIYELFFSLLALLLKIINIQMQMWQVATIALILAVLFFAKQYQNFIDESEKTEKRLHLNKKIGALSSTFWYIIFFLFFIVIALFLWSIIVNYLI